MKFPTPPRNKHLLVARWSLQGFLLSALMVAVSGLAQFVLIALGAQLYFLGFLPAVFLTGLFAGWPAAGVAALLTVPLVWWAFMPPHFEFGPLTHADYEAIKVFVLCSALLAMLSDLGQQMLAVEIDPTEDPDN